MFKFMIFTYFLHEKKRQVCNIGTIVDKMSGILKMSGQLKTHSDKKQKCFFLMIK